VRLQLSQCTIRPWTENDAPSLQRHANNRRVSMHLRDRFPFPYEMEQAQTFLGRIVTQQTPTVWAIEVGGEAIGGIGIEPDTDVERVSGRWATGSAKPSGDAALRPKR